MLDIINTKLAVGFSTLLINLVRGLLYVTKILDQYLLFIIHRITFLINQILKHDHIKVTDQRVQNMLLVLFGVWILFMFISFVLKCLFRLCRCKLW